MIKKDKKKKSGFGDLIAGLFSAKDDGAGLNLFGEKKEEEPSSFYGDTKEDGDSFNSSYYEPGEKGSEPEEGRKREGSRLQFLKYMGWLEYVVIAVEVFLIIYTVLVLLNLAPIF